ncbi:MAG: amidohydrolase family protein [Candidatus Heimdallarchaeota archaeon]|nr:MAG: amidohydrolase family protein [Candidatus Heimdallarchaeota archaeon]
MDLLIKNAYTRDGKLVNILVEYGMIREITGKKLKEADQTIDAKGSLVTESLISPHNHLDKVLIGDIIEPNESGTLWEAIQKTWEVKRNYTAEEIYQRASQVIDHQIKYGVTHFRTHVDVDSIGKLTPLKGLLAVKEAYRNIIELQVVAFPQEGILKDEGTEDLLYSAMETGANLIGGMPHNEFTPQDSRHHIDILFDIAKQFNVDIDSHTDETDDPNSRTLQYLASSTIKRDYRERVSVDHICSLAAQNDYYASRIIELVKLAEINVITNPGTNMVLQGRLDNYPKRVGITRVKQLVEAGVNVTAGQDCINDPYYPFGKGDMLEVALLLGHAAKLTTNNEINSLYDMITYNAAKTMGISDHRLVEDTPANLVILHGVKTVNEAIRKTPPARTTIRKGKIISKTSLTEEQYYEVEKPKTKN